MGKKTKKIQYFYRPMPYYPMMYYQGRKTKKKSRNEFQTTYGDNFTPQLMMANPKKKIRFGKKDKPKKIASNILDLYNIDFNPQFLDFAFKKFHNKINEYRSILNDYNYYVDSVNGIKSSTELLELQTVMNPNELHLLLEGIDVLFESAKSDKEKFVANVKSNMVNILQRGGGYVRKYDIIAFLNGDKRNRIKNRICDIIYLNREDKSDHPLFENYGDGVKEKIDRLRNDETMDSCFNMFLQQKILTHLNVTDKDKNAYYRGEFQTTIVECEKKEYYDHRMFYKRLKKSGLISNKDPPNFKSLTDPTPAINDIYRKMDDNFEFYSGLSMLNIQKLDDIRLAGEIRGKYLVDNEKLYDELTELIQAFHEVQIPDTDAARAKEKKMKDYLGNISFAIIMGGLLPPSFFGPDYDYNPFDVLSVIMCIFEGSTVCALMSALPLFSPLMDALATFSIFRKIFRKIGIGDNLGIRSKKAISDAFAAKIAKENKMAETVNQLRTNIHKANKNLLKAKKAKQYLKATKIEKDLIKFAKQNQKLAKAKEASDAAALKARRMQTEKSYKKFMKEKPKIMKKIKNGDELSNTEKILLKETNEFFATKGVGIDASKMKTPDGIIPSGFGKEPFKKKFLSEYNDINRKISESGDTNVTDLWAVGSRDGFFKVQNRWTSSVDLKNARSLSRKQGVYVNKMNADGKILGKKEIYAETAKQYDAVMAARDLQKQFDSGDFGADFVQNLIKERPDVHKFLDDAFPGKFTQEAVDTAKRTGVNKIRVSNDEADFFLDQMNMQFVKIAGDNYYGPVRMLNKSKSYYESTGILINSASDYTKAMKPHLFPQYSVSIKMSDQLTDATKLAGKVSDDAVLVADNVVSVVKKGSDDASKYFDDMFSSGQKNLKDITTQQRNLNSQIDELTRQIDSAPSITKAKRVGITDSAGYISNLKAEKTKLLDLQTQGNAAIKKAEANLKVFEKTKKAKQNILKAEANLKKLQIDGASPEKILEAKKKISSAVNDSITANKNMTKHLEASRSVSKASGKFNNAKIAQDAIEQARIKSAIAETNLEAANLKLKAAETKLDVVKSQDLSNVTRSLKQDEILQAQKQLEVRNLQKEISKAADKSSTAAQQQKLTAAQEQLNNVTQNILKKKKKLFKPDEAQKAVDKALDSLQKTKIKTQNTIANAQDSISTNFLKIEEQSKLVKKELSQINRLEDLRKLDPAKMTEKQIRQLQRISENPTIQKMTDDLYLARAQAQNIGTIPGQAGVRVNPLANNAAQAKARLAQEADLTLKVKEELLKKQRGLDEILAKNPSVKETASSLQKKAAAGKLKDKVKYLEYEKAVEPLTTPLEKIQQSLDTVASAYLVDYNLTEQVSSSKNAELDAVFIEQNNLILDKIWSDQAQKTVSTVGKMLMPDGTGNLVTLADTIARYSTILDPGTDARKKRNEVLYGRVKKGINDREKNRQKKEERAKMSGLTTDTNIKILENEFKRNRLEMKQNEKEAKKEMRRYERELEETENLGEIVDRQIRRNVKISKAMGEKLPKKKHYKLKERKKLLEGAKEATFADNTAFNTSLDFFEKQQKCMAPDQKIRQGRCKNDEEAFNFVTRKTDEGIQERKTIIIPEGFICCEKNFQVQEAIGGREEQTYSSGIQMPNMSVGGGKKNLTMRNEIYNDNQLGEEIEKFRRKFKKYKKDFDEPLQELMNKRSQYRLQQKSKLKDKYLTLFRTLRDDIKMAEDRKTTMEYEIFQNMSNKFKEEMKKVFKDMSIITRNLFTRNTVDLGTYYASKSIINEYEKIEEEINTLSEDKEIGDFRKEFDEKVKSVLLQEKKVEKVKREIQEFKAKEDDLDKEKEILKKLLEERNNFGAKTDKEKKYSQKIVLLKEIQKEYDATQVFVNPDPKLEKMYLTAKNMKKNKSGLFTRFQDKVTTEIYFIRNEYDIAVFLSLPIPEIKKLNLVRYLQEIYLDIVRVREAMKKINVFYKKENKKINVELDDAKKQMKFYYENLSKITRKEDKILFNKRFQNRQKNMKLLIDTQKNIVEEYFINLNAIDKCKDLMVYCDFQISDIKTININRETKNLLLSEKTGLVDITQLHEFKETAQIKTDDKEILQILKNILKYKKKINKSRKAVYKTITNKNIKQSKLKKELKKKTLKRNVKKEKELKRQMDVVNRRIDSYELTSLGYMNMENPMDILVFYGLLTVGIVKKKTYYTFNDDILNSLNIKKTKEMDKILNEINYFILEEQVI